MKRGMNVPKLSELADDVEIVSESYGKVEVGEVKTEITTYGNDASKHTWNMPIPRKWQPDAGCMLDQYIENQYDEMYEGWDDRARDCLTKEVYAKIQTILDEAFSNGHATEYWEYGEEVEIDIWPQATETTESA